MHPWLAKGCNTNLICSRPPVGCPADSINSIVKRLKVWCWNLSMQPQLAYPFPKYWFGATFWTATYASKQAALVPQSSPAPHRHLSARALPQASTTKLVVSAINQNQLDFINNCLVLKLFDTYPSNLKPSSSPYSFTYNNIGALWIWYISPIPFYYSRRRLETKPLRRSTNSPNSLLVFGIRKEEMVRIWKVASSLPVEKQGSV